MQIYQIFYNIVLIQVKLTFDRKICGSIFATSINVVVEEKLCGIGIIFKSNAC